MIIFGWIMLTLIAWLITFAGLIFAYAGSGFSGKTDREAWIFIAIGSFLFYLSYYNFPFVLVVK